MVLVTTARNEAPACGRSYTPAAIRIGELRQERTEAVEGAAVLYDVEVIGEHLAVPRPADLVGLPLAPAVHHAHHVLAAGLDPADRVPGVLGRPGDADGVPVHRDLGAEPAAHIRRDHPDRRRVHAPAVPAMAPRASCAFWVLDQIVSRSPVQAAAIARGSSGTGASRWFTIVRSSTTSQPSKLASSHFPRRPGADDVALRAGEQQRLAGQGLLDAGDRGQRVVVDADQFRRVLALVAAVGQDQGHGLADVAHPVGREQRLGRDVAALRRGGQVGGGEHGDHPGQLGGRAGVDPGDQRVRDRAAHDGDDRPRRSAPAAAGRRCTRHPWSAAAGPRSAAPACP